MPSKKWKYDSLYDRRIIYGDKLDNLRLSYLEKLTYLECAIMGVEPEIIHDGSITFDSDKMYTPLGSENPREPLWDFEDVLERAIELSKK
jgi:hypothetical protein